MTESEKVGAVIAAGGTGTRMGGVDKMFAALGGKAVLARVVEVFQNSQSVHQIVVVLNEANLGRGRDLVTQEGWTKVTDVCPGGERRQDSVAAGLKLLKDCRWAIIQDGARPLVTEELITGGLGAARDSGAAVAAVPVTDTIKVSGPDGFVQGTPPRANLWAVQTPQVFRFDIIMRAYQQVKYEVTDDSRLVEVLGHRVKLYMGSYDNIKITTPTDLALAEILWRERRGRSPAR